jgi:hypothetical protein
MNIMDYLRRDHVIISLMACVPLLTCSLILRDGVAARAVFAVFATVAFTAFDVSGYKWLLDEGKRPDVLPYYRMMQVLVQALLYILAWRIGGWTVAVATFSLWWTGCCDLLYYWMGFYKLYSGAWTWLWWTPLGIPPYLIGRFSGLNHDQACKAIAMKTPVVITQAIVGFVGATVMVVII